MCSLLRAAEGMRAGLLNDLHKFDLGSSTWTMVPATDASPAPSPRRSHGFAGCGGKLYVFGGWDGQGEWLPLHVMPYQSRF